MSFVHPYMPNSAPAVQREMLDELGINCIEDLYRDLIPEHLRFRGQMNLPRPILGEFELKKHVEDILKQNISCNEYVSFLGAGCYQHYVPAICDEINSRSEFLTAYCGDTYCDHGKMQAIFEYCSMMAELVDMDVVSYTNYDGGQAVASSLRMALRITGKSELLLPATMNPEILSLVRDYCKHVGKIKLVNYTAKGLLDLVDLENKLSDKTAAVFFENPSYLGFIETQGKQIADVAHKAGAICIVNADAASLGILESPANYGADIICGDIQPLGMHIQFGGGQAGYIASRQDEAYIQQYPTYLYGIARTGVQGEYGWGRALNYRCSHGSREKAHEYFGTASGLWAITAAVYLAVMGPQGMQELGETILYRTNYAIKELAEIKGIQANIFGTANFQEFVVNFDDCGKTVAEINKDLLSKGIFGGKDLSREFPALGQSALYCITEMISAEDIRKLSGALREIVGQEGK